MNFYKKFLKYTLEICMSIFIIMFGYTLWNNFDNTNYMIAKSNSNLNEVQVYLDENKLYLHNISKNKNKKKLCIKIDKEDNTFIDNTKIIIDDKVYNLTDYKTIEDEYYKYIILNNLDFNSYETKEYNVAIDTKITNYNYEFTTTI